MNLLNCGSNINFVEIGHFYTNEEYKKGQLDYLKDFTFHKEDHLALFIDNFFFPQSNLDIKSLLEDAREITNKKVSLYFEGDMVCFYNKGMSFLGIEHLSTVSERGFTYLYWNNNRIAQLFPSFRPTCLMLSFIWTLYRLQRSKSVTTIIDSKYKKLETNMLKMLPLELREKCFYHFI